MTRIIDPLDQFFDDAGDPLVNGLLYFYQTGTNTPLNTYADVNLTIPNANPLPLTGAGRCPNAYGLNQLYRVVLKTAEGVQIMQRDNVGSAGAEGNFTAWNNERIYSYPEITLYSNKYYMSVTNGNQGNTPDAATQWMQIRFLNEYEASFTYSVDDVVTYAGYLYASATNSNSGNTPTTSHANWQRISNIPHWGVNTTYRQYDYVIDSSGGLNKAATNTIGSNPTTPSINWNKIKEHFSYNSAKTYVAGDYVYDGEKRYVSKQSSNTNHQPSADTTETWWRPDWQDIDPICVVKYLSGGGALIPRFDNWVTDSSSYSIPAANTVPVNTILVVTKPDKYRTNTPTIAPSGGDYFEWSGANDFSGVQMLTTHIEVLKFISNGSNGWRIG